MCRTENSECLFSRMKTILRLSFPLVAAEIAISFNGFTDGIFLSRLSEAALRASLPANMIAACVLAPITAALSYSGTLVTWLRPSAAAYWLTIAVHTLLRALVNLRSLRRPSQWF